MFGENEDIRLFRSGERTESMQEFHTPEAVQFVEEDLKKTLQGLAKWLFGPGTYLMCLGVSCWGNLYCFNILSNINMAPSCVSGQNDLVLCNLYNSHIHIPKKITFQIIFLIQYQILILL